MASMTMSLRGESRQMVTERLFVVGASERENAGAWRKSWAGNGASGIPVVEQSGLVDSQYWVLGSNLLVLASMTSSKLGQLPLKPVQSSRVLLELPTAYTHRTDMPLRTTIPSGTKKQLKYAVGKPT